MKVELSNKHNDAFSASSIIGEKLLRGWTLLNASCHIVRIVYILHILFCFFFYGHNICN